MQEKKKYYIVYQITNKINEKVYIGVHMTENVNDKYFGSGTNIKKAIKKFGKENFEKILLHNFDTSEEMLEKERELVNNEFIKRGDTYNIILGGGGLKTENCVTVKDKDGNTFDVHKTDPRYLSGELVHISTGMVNVMDKDGNTYCVHKTDPKYLSGELYGANKNKIPIIGKDGNVSMVSINDPRYLSGELVHVAKGLITVKDINGNTCSVSINDPRYLSGELVNIWQGKKHNIESCLKMSIAKKGKYKGKENSQYGTCWVYNLEMKVSKKIKNIDLDVYLKKGWVKGRKMKF